ncbi:ABC transporter ATP-binding protein [Sporolactobacillus sp. THM7-7]|nr:ABC transporter ATP-binding protein [Sporolactobacillus sp. THM7-7]
MENIMALNHVTKRFKGFALEDVSFSLKKGFIMGFVGPNGAGKSTTIRCIMDLIHIDSGDIELFGENIRNRLIDLKQRIGFVYDQDVFYGDLTAEKNKRVIAPFYKRWNDEAFYRYIKAFDVPLNKKLRTFSKGVKMKFALAMALSHHAELIIMDEPTSGLDPIFRKELLDILMDVIQDENKAIFFSTHITTDLEKVADYITFILDGKILLSEETNDLLEAYTLVKGPTTLETDIKAARPIALKATSLGFEAFMEGNAARQLTRKANFRLERPSLEEIMYYLVKARKR